MKIFVSLSLLLILSAGIYAQDYAMNSVKVLNGAALNWENEVINLGELTKGTVTTAEFGFTNNGTQALVIERVKTSCGCTASNYPEQPIQPGESASIEVSFSAKTIGSFHKSITVYSNAIEPVSTVRIKGTVK